MNPSPKKVNLIIFDCDGVLVDSEKICIQALRDLLGKHGISRSYQEVVDTFHGLSQSQTTDQLNVIFKANIPADFSRLFVITSLQRLQNELKPVEGVHALLNEITIPFCVASNGTRSKVISSLSITGLLEKFKGRIFCAEDVKNPKPHPELFLMAANTLSVRPENCLVVEDSIAGIQAARAAGMRVYAYPGVTSREKLLAANPSMILSEMKDMRDIILSLNE